MVLQIAVPQHSSRLPLHPASRFSPFPPRPPQPQHSILICGVAKDKSDRFSRGKWMTSYLFSPRLGRFASIFDRIFRTAFQEGKKRCLLFYIVFYLHFILHRVFSPLVFKKSKTYLGIGVKAVLDFHPVPYVCLLQCRSQSRSQRARPTYSPHSRSPCGRSVDSGPCGRSEGGSGAQAIAVSGRGFICPLFLAKTGNLYLF